MNAQHLIERMHREMSSGVATSSLVRLRVATLLGRLIGLERERKHRAAGLRTNLFLCFGAASFTILSQRLAGAPSDAARIGAQIIPGIGFIGAGSILHMRGLTTGLATLMQNVAIGTTGQPVRLQFAVEGCNRDQKQLFGELKASTVLGSVVSLGPVERE